MLIDLYQFIQEEQASKVLVPTYEEKRFKTKDSSYEIVDCNLKLSLRNAGDKKVDCKLAGTVGLMIPCDCCLEPVLNQIGIDFHKELDMNKSMEEKIEELDEECFVVENSLDVDALIHNEILINLPMKVLCKEDCKGICRKCGVNLNMGSCKCDQTELDPRMSKILDVFNQFKEV
ncbi:MAG: DUF177 domain-containing protein [Eubacterium sp.]|nr:DUF177 domain-containing protein [Eubacterium sp.]